MSTYIVNSMYTPLDDLPLLAPSFIPHLDEHTGVRLSTENVGDLIGFIRTNFSINDKEQDFVDMYRVSAKISGNLYVYKKCPIPTYSVWEFKAVCGYKNRFPINRTYSFVSKLARQPTTNFLKMVDLTQKRKRSREAENTTDSEDSKNGESETTSTSDENDSDFNSSDCSTETSEDRTMSDEFSSSSSEEEEEEEDEEDEEDEEEDSYIPHRVVYTNPPEDRSVEYVIEQLRNIKTTHYPYLNYTNLITGAVLLLDIGFSVFFLNSLQATVMHVYQNQTI
jgi:hypothetical protein